MEQQRNGNLIIEPSTHICFYGPFEHPIVQFLTLKNPTASTMLFKIKTTVPKQYCVRPNFGSISPNGVAKIEICLQPMSNSPDDKQKHKFLIQSLKVPKKCGDYNKLWKEVPPDQLSYAKLRCVFNPTPISNELKGYECLPPMDAVNKMHNIMQKKMVSEVGTVQESMEGIQNLKAKLKNAVPNILSDDIIWKMKEMPNPQMLALLREVRELHEEVSDLERDNINLKEQIMRFEALPQSRPETNLQSKPSVETVARPIIVQQRIPKLFIAISVFVSLICLLLGKYVL